MFPLTAQIKGYLYLALTLAILGGFVGYTVHERHEGAAHEVAAVAKATKEAQEKADIETKALAARAAKAEENYANEHQSLLDYVASNPIQPVRLCLRTAPTSVPSATAAVGGSKGTNPATGDVLQVPAGNSQLRSDLGPDISGMLSLLAERADQIAAQARELQAR